MKNINRTMLIIILLAIAVVIAAFSAFHFSHAEDEDEVATDTLMKHTAIQQKEIDLIEKLGGNTPYPQIYVTAETLVQLKGYDKDKAVQEAADRYVERKALVWAAEKNGILVSDQEFESYIQMLIDSIKTADNYDELKAAYDANGLTLDELYRGNEEFYRDNYIIDKLYDKWLQQRLDGETKVSQDEQENLDKTWETFIKETVDEYKKSKTFKAAKLALDASKKIYSAKQTTNVTELKNEKIWIDVNE
ncbi:MAG: hypothetical protein Q4E84_02485 [Clostridia bacterium]|nr:hypothetical protein [Clostridia bacterium]